MQLKAGETIAASHSGCLAQTSSPTKADEFGYSLFYLSVIGKMIFNR